MVAAGWPLATAVVVGGAGVAIVEALNGNDDFGRASGAISETGSMVLEFRGPDGSANVPVSASSQIAQLPFVVPCSPSPSPGAQIARLDAASTIDDIFSELSNVADRTNRMAGIYQEHGVEPRLTERQMGDIVRTFSSAIVRTAEMSSAILIQEAAWTPDVLTAIDLYQRAQSHLSENNAEAGLMLFQKSFREAFNLLQTGGRSDDKPNLLPNQVVLNPDFISTTRSRHVRITGFVAGLQPNERVGEIKIAELAFPELEWSARVYDRGVFRLDLNFENAPKVESPMDWALSLIVRLEDEEQGGSRSLEGSATVVLNPPKQ